MRYLFIVVTVGWLGMGCATSREQPQPGMTEAERWRQEYEAERERAEALAVRLAELENALEALALQRAEAEQLSRLLEEELLRSEADRHALEEHNAQLMVRQRELTALQEELSDVWYQSALSRARRRSQPPVAAPGSAPRGNAR